MEPLGNLCSLSPYLGARKSEHPGYGFSTLNHLPPSPPSQQQQGNGAHRQQGRLHHPPKAPELPGSIPHPRGLSTCDRRQGMTDMLTRPPQMQVCPG